MKALCFAPVAALVGRAAPIPVSCFLFIPAIVEADVVAAPGAKGSRHAATTTTLAARSNPLTAPDPTTEG